MNKTFSRNGRTARGHSVLSLAIAAGIASLATLPASASDLGTLEQAALRASMNEGFRLARAEGAAAAAPLALPQDAFSRRWTAVQPDNPTSPDAWVDDEFNNDWGLAAINAQYAYARGLSGAGIRLGLLDSGAGFDQHPEFAGKDHRGMVMADLLADGTRCSDATVLAGPDACFYSQGDQVALEAEYYDPELQVFFPNPANDYLWGNTFFYYNSHGTHVAGTIAANRDGNGMHGVAFGADLSSARLFNDSLTVVDLPCLLFGDCLQFGTDASASAVEYMYEQAIAHGVRAMNHSWGYTYEAYSPEVAMLYNDLLMSDPEISATLEAMADASRRSGMVQVVSAGNTNAVIANPGAASPHATAPATLPSIFPEIEQYWVSVVNLTDQLELSNRSMKCGITAQWCIAAPGSLITSTVLTENDDLTGDWVVDDNGNLRFEIDGRAGIPDYADYSGTSMAAPHVTGALGLLFERFPYLTGAQVRDVMLTTASDLGAEGVDEVYGWGLLDLRKAIEGYGQLRVDTEVVMDRAAGGAKVWEGGAWDDWTNDIGGPGHLTKAGRGWLRLSGDNTFGGATVTAGILELDGANRLSDDVRVDGGTLVVNGSLDGSRLEVLGGVAVVNGTVSGGSTRVARGGTLGGSGTLGDTRVAGTVAPGNSIGTLTIDGDYVQEAGARFVAELLPPDQSDLLHVTGTATLNGGTLVASNLAGDDYLLGQQYRVLSADGGITGAFAGVDGSALSPFLALSLRQAANTVSVDVARGAALASAARSANQAATAGALDALAIDQGLPVLLTQLDFATAPAAFNSLSGEIHASARQVLLEGSRLVRDAALGRANGGGLLGNLNEGDSGAWVQAQHQGGDVGGDGNAATVQYSGNALLAGLDREVGAGWRLGAYGGTGETDLDVRNRGSRGEVRSRHLGVYAGSSWGALGLSLGYTHSWHRLEIERTAAFPGFSQALASRYDADGGQVYADLGYRFARQGWELEPYVQYAHVKVDAEGFRERSGIAALQGRGGESRVDLATAGLRFAANVAGRGQDQPWLSLRGNVGYRHAGGDQVQHVDMAFDQGPWFGVASPAITDEAVLAQLGVAARTSARSLLELGMSHVESDQANDTGLNARFTVNF